jgi:hypothetical protein
MPDIDPTFGDVSMFYDAHKEYIDDYTTVYKFDGGPLWYGDPGYLLGIFVSVSYSFKDWPPNTAYLWRSTTFDFLDVYVEPYE